MRKVVVDIAFFGGAGSFLYGVHEVYPPAALIAGGLLAMLFALVAARSEK